MGAANFLFGISARQTSPILINWFSSLFIAVFCFVYLIAKSELKETLRFFARNKKLVLGASLIDNLAWVAYSYSTLFIPIAIATGISESYIALAAFLGFIFNKEKLKKHQFLGFILAIISAVVLGFLTAD
jgi:drug/metabolite transporter (DMT)-like permease